METKLSNNTILKFFNKELSALEMKRVGTIIANSENYKKIINELNATYNLTNEKEILENNPHLYLNLINKITEQEVPKNSYTFYFSDSLFKPVLGITSILIFLYNVFILYNIGNEPTNELSHLNNKSEVYFNDLQLEKMENVLLIKEQK